MWSTLFIILFFAFATALLITIPRPNLNRRVFLPLHGFGQFVRLGTLLNLGIALGAIVILALSMASPHLPVGDEASENRFAAMFASWVMTVLTFRYIIRADTFAIPYELQWGDKRRRLNLTRLFGRCLIGFELLLMLEAAIEIFL